jgi:hypothetical protein
MIHRRAQLLAGRARGAARDGRQRVGERGTAEQRRSCPPALRWADIAYLGLVIEASGDYCSANTPFTFFNERKRDCSRVGRRAPASTLGVYRKRSDAAHHCTLRLLASTPTLPKGIQNVVNAAQREGSALREKAQPQRCLRIDLGDLADLDLLPARSGSMPPVGRPRGAPRAAEPAVRRPAAPASASTRPLSVQPAQGQFGGAAGQVRARLSSSCGAPAPCLRPELPPLTLRRRPNPSPHQFARRVTGSRANPPLVCTCPDAAARRAHCPTTAPIPHAEPRGFAPSGDLRSPGRCLSQHRV